MEIEKKIWPRDFESVKDKDRYMEIRLADFEVNVGDTIIIREWDPTKQKYTGREAKFKVKELKKLDLRKFYKPEEISKYGIYAIEMER